MSPDPTATAAGRGSIAYEPCPQDGHSHDWRDCPTPEDWATTTAAYGVRFLSDGSVAHPWNGRTQEQRAREYLAELRATYTRDRFALVIRDAPDQPWREVDE